MPPFEFAQGNGVQAGISSALKHLCARDFATAIDGGHDDSTSRSWVTAPT